MKYYNIKTADTNDYIVGVDYRKRVPELKTFVGDLESTLFAFRGGGYVFETKGERDYFWLRVYSNSPLEIARSSRKGFFAEEISEGKARELEKGIAYLNN